MAERKAREGEPRPRKLGKPPVRRTGTPGRESNGKGRPAPDKKDPGVDTKKHDN